MKNNERFECCKNKLMWWHLVHSRLLAIRCLAQNQYIYTSFTSIKTLRFIFHCYIKSDNDLSIYHHFVVLSVKYKLPPFVSVMWVLPTTEWMCFFFFLRIFRISLCKIAFSLFRERREIRGHLERSALKAQLYVRFLYISAIYT